MSCLPRHLLPLESTRSCPISSAHLKMLAVPWAARKIRIEKFSSSVVTAVAPRIWQEPVGPNRIQQVIRVQETGKGDQRDRTRRGRERQVKRLGRCRGEDRVAPTKEREGNQAICTIFGGGASLKGLILSHLCKLCGRWHLGRQGSCGRGLRRKFLSRAVSSYV